MPLNELERSVVASGNYLELLSIKLQGGKTYDAVNRVGNKNAVAGLLRHRENQSYIVIEQYRYPLKARVLELVAGVIDKPGKSKKDILKEEVMEETGYSQIENIDFLSVTSASAGQSTEVTYLYDIEISGEKGLQNLGSLEDIEVIEVPYQDFARFLKEKAQSGIIIDPKVGMALYMTGEKVRNVL